MSNETSHGQNLSGSTEHGEIIVAGDDAVILDGLTEEQEQKARREAYRAVERAKDGARVAANQLLDAIKDLDPEEQRQLLREVSK